MSKLFASIGALAGSGGTVRLSRALHCAIPHRLHLENLEPSVQKRGDRRPVVISPGLGAVRGSLVTLCKRRRRSLGDKGTRLRFF